MWLEALELTLELWCEVDPSGLEQYKQPEYLFILVFVYHHPHQVCCQSLLESILDHEGQTQELLRHPYLASMLIVNVLLRIGIPSQHPPVIVLEHLHCAFTYKDHLQFM